MTELRDIRALQQVTEAGYAAAEARMARLRQHEMAILQQLQQLQQAEGDRLRQRSATDSALRAGADLRWERWIGERRSQLNSLLARLRAQMEGERAQLARAFGRKMAMDETAAQLKAQAAQQKLRRALRDG